MKWYYLNTGLSDGKFNMDLDIELTNCVNNDEAILRLYRWNPYCISLGANQSTESINLDKAGADNINVVKRPTGGRAILHSEELTYSVILPIELNGSAKSIYYEINLALLEGLKIYDSKLSSVELENRQPNFPEFYKQEKSAICFAVSAKSELKFTGKKLVGSAQRKLGNKILQHGSILCGDYHLKIVDYLIINTQNKNDLRNEIKNTTTDLRSALSTEVIYAELEEAILKGFQKYFKSEFENLPADNFEKSLV